MSYLARDQRMFLATLLATSIFAGVGQTSVAVAQDQPLKFQLSSDKHIRFDTGIVRGRLQKENLSFGLHDMEDCATGQSICGMYGLFNVYRVFSDGVRYGSAGWSWPSEVTMNADGTVSIRSPAQSDRPFELLATYSLVAPDTIDLELTVTPQRDLHAFEVFLASYFDAAYNQAAAYVNAPYGPTFRRAVRTMGHWLTFPRDQAAVTLVQDGRWTLPPNPVVWAIRTRLAEPIAVRRPSVPARTAVLMAPKKDCFAISMPFETEGHYSIYLSLFGHDLPAQQRATSRARLVFLEYPADQAVVQAFKKYSGAAP
jgi:hypothetical protein